MRRSQHGSKARGLSETAMCDLLCRRPFPVSFKGHVMEVGKRDAGDAGRQQLTSSKYGQDDGPARNADVKSTKCHIVANKERIVGQCTEEKKKGPAHGLPQKGRIRARTFPLAPAVSILPPAPDYILPVVRALDFLYSGPPPSTERFWQHEPLSACVLRALRSLQERMPSQENLYDKSAPLPSGGWGIGN